MSRRLLSVSGRLALATVFAAAALVDVPASRAAGDPAAGRQLTERVCADCHLTPRGTGGGDGPSLDRLSRERSFSPDRLADVMKSDPHDLEVRLRRRELRDISAYLNVAGTPGAGAGKQTAETPGSGPAASRDPATGADDRTAGAVDGAGDLSAQGILSRLDREGYSDIREIEREDAGRYEVDARAPTGERVELYVDAATGEVLEREDD